MIYDEKLGLVAEPKEDFSWDILAGTAYLGTVGISKQYGFLFFVPAQERAFQGWHLQSIAWLMIQIQLSPEMENELLRIEREIRNPEERLVQ